MATCGSDVKAKTKSNTKSKTILTKFYKDSSLQLEIGVDEVGRGPMFGRVYSAAVILPKSESFKYEVLKDSKRFTNEKKIKEVASYIKENAVAWAIGYEDEATIDNVNIRQATFKAMHKAISNVVATESNSPHKQFYLLIDGNDFKPYIYMNQNTDMLEQINHILVEGGDNKYCSIAAASILAKVARDDYIRDMCDKYPILDEYYGLLNNKGYGTAIHMEGIATYGITRWHRKSFGICKEMRENDVGEVDA